MRLRCSEQVYPCLKSRGGEGRPPSKHRLRATPEIPRMQFLTLDPLDPRPLRCFPGPRVASGDQFRIEESPLETNFTSPVFSAPPCLSLAPARNPLSHKPSSSLSASRISAFDSRIGPPVPRSPSSQICAICGFPPNPPTARAASRLNTFVASWLRGSVASWLRAFPQSQLLSPQAFFKFVSFPEAPPDALALACRPLEESLP